MEPADFSPQQSLQLIEAMINKAKNRISENGFLYRLWGWVILISAISHFVLLQIKIIPHPEIVWFSCIATVIFQLVYLNRSRKKSNVKTYSEEIIDYVWISFGACMIVVSFISGKSNSWIDMYPIIIMLYGIPSFLSGVIMRFTPLKAGGICCFILAIIASYIHNEYILLVLAAAVIVAWIIPGYILKSRFKKLN